MKQVILYISFLASFSLIFAQEMEPTIAPSEVTSVNIQEVPEATVDDTSALQDSAVTQDIEPIALVFPEGGVQKGDSAGQMPPMKNPEVVATAMNVLAGFNLGYRGAFSQSNQNSATFHTYFGLLCYETEAVFVDGQYHDWTHYLGGGLGSFIQLQYGFLEGPNSIRTKLNIPLGPRFLAGVSWDSEDKFGMSLEYNFLVSSTLDDDSP